MYGRCAAGAALQREKEREVRNCFFFFSPRCWAVTENKRWTNKQTKKKIALIDCVASDKGVKKPAQSFLNDVIYTKSA